MCLSPDVTTQIPRGVERVDPFHFAVAFPRVAFHLDDQYALQQRAQISTERRQAALSYREAL